MTRLEQIIAHAAKGLSASQIGEEMGCSRNAVIGCVWRAGLSLKALNGGAGWKRFEECRRGARTDAQRKASSENMKRLHAQPEFRAALNAGRRTPDYRAAASQRLRARWAEIKAAQGASQ